LNEILDTLSHLKKLRTCFASRHFILLKGHCPYISLMPGSFNYKWLAPKLFMIIHPCQKHDCKEFCVYPARTHLDCWTQAWARCYLRAKEKDRKGWEMRLAEQDRLWKSHWNTIHEWQIVTGAIIPDSPKWYFPFTLGHYLSYFINKIAPFNLNHIVKHTFNLGFWF